MKPLPITVVALIEELNEYYPERSPDLGQKLEAIWMQAGARQLVRALNARLNHEEQRGNALRR